MDLISNTEDYLASLFTSLLLFFVNEVFGIISLLQWCVAWEEYRGISTSTGVCSELHETAASINDSVICVFVSALKRSVYNAAVEF